MKTSPPPSPSRVALPVTTSPALLFLDPTLYQWFFFRRSGPAWPLDGEEGPPNFNGEFWEVVQKGAVWAGAPVSGGIPTDKIVPRRSNSLAGSGGWKSLTKKGIGVERDYEFDARALLDVFWLHLGQCQKKDYSALPNLMDDASRFSLKGTLPPHFFLGEARCFFAEVPEAALSMDELHGRAATLVCEWLSTATPEAVTFEFECPLEYGYFARVESPGQANGPITETFVLLVYTKRIKDINALRTQLLPRLALTYLKFRITERDYTALHKNDKAMRARVSRHLKELADGSRGLGALEDYTNTLADDHMALLPIIRTFEMRLQTLRVNAKNLGHDAHDSAWGATPPKKLPLQRDLQSLIEQFESDLIYLSILQKEVDAATERLQTLANVRVGQSERTLALALIVFAAMAVAQVFPEPHGLNPNSYTWRREVIGACIFGAVLLWRFLPPIERGVRSLRAKVRSFFGKRKVAS